MLKYTKVYLSGINLENSFTTNARIKSNTMGGASNSFIAQGFLYKEIGDQLEITIDTVKKHCKSCYRKLNARNKVEAIKKYEDKVA